MILDPSQIPQHRRCPGFRLLFVIFSLALSLPVGTAPQAGGATVTVKTEATPATVHNICAACIRGHMEFLASDALQGRGSGTHDELLAATYIASELRAYGIEPAGDDGAVHVISARLLGWGSQSGHEMRRSSNTADRPHGANSFAPRGSNYLGRSIGRVCELEHSGGAAADGQFDGGT